MNLRDYLDEQGVQYQLSHHPTVYTSQDLAQAAHVPGERVIKPVVVDADGQFVMCALPACYRIDLDELRNQLRADRVRIVDEQTLGRLFPDIELGAEPPIGRLFGIPTVMDDSLTANGDAVTFQAGTHQEAVTMPLDEWRRVTQPDVARFGRHI
jgi:Ala-tRNA(Pro) deacylase